MTNEERQELIATKEEVSQWLASQNLDKYPLAELDPRLLSYCRNVAENPLAHNLYEQLSVRRFLEKIERYGINAGEIWRFIYFYEHLSFPGKRGMQCYALTPVQTFQFANIFGFWHEGKRVVREVVLFVPRKFSKTTSSASLAIYDMLFGEANAESYTGANSQDQAKKCFDVIRSAMRKLDPAGKYYTVNEMMIKSRRRDRSAFAQCLTANARTKDGLNASTVIMDEFSQARDSSLLTVLTTSMGVRDNPLTVIITTASDVFTGPFYSMLQGYKDSLLGKHGEDDSLFAHIFEPDVTDEEDAESTWQKVQPHMGVTVTMDFYRAEWRKAQRDGAQAMLAFRTKLLNLYSENEQLAWISSTQATKMMAQRPPASGKGLITVAIDLSERDDFSAVSYALYNAKAHSMYYHTVYFFPKGALDGHTNEQLYRKWAHAGHLQLTDGDVIDYREIVGYVAGLTKTYSIKAIGYDPWKSTEVINMLSNAGGKGVLRPMKQTYGYFNAAVESFEHGAFNGRIAINDNPINAYCFGNAVIDQDHLENKKPVKRTPSGKIDGVITMLMAHRLWLDSEI